MSTESKNGSDIDPENAIAVTLDDLSEDVRRELEEELEKEKVERLKLKLAARRRRKGSSEPFRCSGKKLNRRNCSSN